MMSASSGIEVEQNIRGLREMVGDEELPDIVATYLHDSEATLTQLDRAVGCGDGRGVAAAAHSLKSAAGLLGSEALAQLCRQLETLGAAGRMTRARAIAGRARREFERLRPGLEPYASVA